MISSSDEHWSRYFDISSLLVTKKGFSYDRPTDRDTHRDATATDRPTMSGGIEIASIANMPTRGHGNEEERDTSKD